jgi:hypothetical protein
VISTGSIGEERGPIGEEPASGSDARVVLVPGVLALLPEYASLTDPVAELRSACLAAVSWLVEDGGPVTVVADAQGRRVAEHLLGVVSASSTAEGRPAGSADPVLVVANGSARRGEKAPGHLDERSFAFDAAIGAALRGPDPGALGQLDAGLGEELLAGNVEGLRALGGVLTPAHRATMDYEDDPFGVRYWVVRWSCGSC